MGKMQGIAAKPATIPTTNKERFFVKCKVRV